MDPDGEDALDAVLGFVNGLGSSLAFNAGRVDADTQNQDFAVGQTLGDATATAAGLITTGAGLIPLGGEGALTVGSGGLALPVTAPAAVLTGAGTLLGAAAAVNGAANTGAGLSNLIFKEKAGGGDQESPLKPLHKDSSLSETRLEHFRKQSTRDLVESLKPGQRESLRVKPDGTIMNGNHRIQVLQERGVDVNSLLREPYQ